MSHDEATSSPAPGAEVSRTVADEIRARGASLIAKSDDLIDLMQQAAQANHLNPVRGAALARATSRGYSQLAMAIETQEEMQRYIKFVEARIASVELALAAKIEIFNAHERAQEHPVVIPKEKSSKLWVVSRGAGKEKRKLKHGGMQDDVQEEIVNNAYAIVWATSFVQGKDVPRYELTLPPHKGVRKRARTYKNLDFQDLYDKLENARMRVNKDSPSWDRLLDALVAYDDAYMKKVRTAKVEGGKK